MQVQINDKNCMLELKKSFFSIRLVMLIAFLLFIGYRLGDRKVSSVIEQWKKLKYTNIVPLIEVFTTKAFGDTCKLRL